MQTWLGRRSADHLGLEPGMLWVRVPPELLERNTSSRSSLECSPPCHGGDVGSNPIEDADMTRYAIWQSGEAQTFVVCGFDSHPCHLIGSCSPRRPVKPLSQNKCGGRREVQFLHDPLNMARSSSGSGYWPLTPVTRVQIPHGSMIRPSGATGRHATLRTSCPYGLGSSNLPLVTAGGAGARRAFIRPGCPDRYRGLQLQTIIAGGPALSGVS